jgi:hydrogenase maturation protease
MNADRVEKIANAVLYEGYLLYPYRSSAVKNQQRFNFGVLYPRGHCEQNPGSDAWEMQTECLVRGSGVTTIEIKTRFLHMVEREGRQEGLDRAVLTPACGVRALAKQSLRQGILLEGETTEQYHSESLEGELELSAASISEGLYRVTLRVRNSAAPAEGPNREAVLLRSLVSVHSILQVTGGSFISLLDPPDEFRQAAEDCRNIGCWPVLVGEDAQTDIMLASPIILYDYPQIAPESSGDLFDGCEIDEILALRILTLTDEEKEEVRNGDERARRILERTESLPPEHFQKLHGAMRGLNK